MLLFVDHRGIHTRSDLPRSSFLMCLGFEPTNTISLHWCECFNNTPHRKASVILKLMLHFWARIKSWNPNMTSTWENILTNGTQCYLDLLSQKKLILNSHLYFWTNQNWKVFVYEADLEIEIVKPEMSSLEVTSLWRNSVFKKDHAVMSLKANICSINWDSDKDNRRNSLGTMLYKDNWTG